MIKSSRIKKEVPGPDYANPPYFRVDIVQEICTVFRHKRYKLQSPMKGEEGIDERI